MILPPSDAERLEQIDTIMAYKRLFAHGDGQAVLRDLISRFGYTRTTTLVPGQPDKTAFNEGQRNVLVHIGRNLDITPESLEKARASLIDEGDDE